MNHHLSIIQVIAVLYLLFSGFSGRAQDCSNPQLLCGQSAAEELTTADGDSVGVPVGICFSVAPNAIFFEFNTLDLNQFPGLAYEDSSATVSISGLVCNADTLLGQGVNIAIFSAFDPCDPTSYDAPLICQTDVTNAMDISLESLEPATTYYVMITGIFGPPPAIDPSECVVSLSVSGPAVTYDLEGDWYPDGAEDRQPKILFNGETVVLTANPDLSGILWTGPNLNESSGTSVTANPEGIGIVDYIVEATINDCIYNEVVSVVIREPIRPDNVFTPNGDLYNDAWYIENIAAWRNAQITVFSRWGAKVFQTTNYQNDWGGDQLPAATYYYVIVLNPIDGNVDPITGSVTILR